MSISLKTLYDQVQTIKNNSTAFQATVEYNGSAVQSGNMKNGRPKPGYCYVLQSTQDDRTATIVWTGNRPSQRVTIGHAEQDWCGIRENGTFITGIYCKVSYIISFPLCNI